MKKNTLTGKCLCGAVKFRATPEKAHAGACHCKMCRNWCSGPFMAVMCGNSVEFDGTDNISIYSSSEWAERGFCKTCGTNLFWRLADGREYGMAAGAFDDQSALTFTSQVFTDENPGWYEFANETHDMTGPEVIAMYSGTGSSDL